MSHSKASRELAATLLASKGRTASVSAEEGPSTRPQTRLFRAISNQIEEEAVDGLLADLMSPIDTRSDPAPSVLLSSQTATSSHPVPAPSSSSRPVASDSSDEGVSDSSDDETVVPTIRATPAPVEELKRLSSRASLSIELRKESDASNGVAATDTSAVGHGASAGDDDETFFSDEMGSPRLGPQVAGEPPKSPGKKPPPAQLVQQVSEVSWVDYLRQACPVCVDIQEGGSASSALKASRCGPCGKLVCSSCVQVYRQGGAESSSSVVVRVCPKCRGSVPEDGVAVCAVCVSVPIGASAGSRACTECHRTVCDSCIKSYVLRSLGEEEPRAICASCVTEVQRSLGALQRDGKSPRDSKSPRENKSPRDGKSPAEDKASLGQPPAQRRLDKSQSQSAFWRIRSPRRVEGSSGGGAETSRLWRGGTSTRKLKVSSAGTSTSLSRGGASGNDPFPGVKLHQAASASMPETLVRRGSRPAPPRAQVVFKEPVAEVAAASLDFPSNDVESPGRLKGDAEKGLVIFDFMGDKNSGELSVQCGMEVLVWRGPGTEESEGWVHAQLLNSPEASSGLVPLENISFDPVMLASAARLRQNEDRTEARFPTGSFVRTRVDGRFVECEVLREGGPNFPYRLRTLDVDASILQVEETAIKPSLRRTASESSVGRSLISKRPVVSVELDHAEAAEQDVLDSLKAKVLILRKEKMDQEVVDSKSDPSPAPALSSSTDVSVGSTPSGGSVPATGESAFSKGKALLAAVRANDPGRMLQVLDSGADPNWSTNKGETALLLAARLGSVERFKCMRMLLERDASADTQMGSGWTALHFVVKDQAYEAARLLRSYGARTDVMNEWLKSPLDMAKDKKDTEMVEILTQKSTPRRKSVLNASSSTLKKSEPTDGVVAKAPSGPDGSDGPVSTEALSVEAPKIEQEGAKTSDASNDPDMVRVGSSEAIEQVSAEVGTEMTSSPTLREEKTATESILSGPKEEDVSPAQALEELERIISPSPVLAPAAAAAAAATPDPPALSAAPSGDGYIRTPQDRPAPPVAAPVPTSVTLPFRHGPTKSVIAARPKAKQKNPNRRSRGSDLVRSLVDAARLGDVPRMNALLSQGCPLNTRDPVTGNTPLIAAVLGGSNVAIMYLLDRPDINLNTPNRAGDTVLHVLAATDNIDAAVWLIQRGADMHARNAVGKTALEINSELAAKVQQRVALGDE